MGILDFIFKKRPDAASLDRRAAGAAGEDEAAAAVKRAGMKVLERNFRCRSGEVDIIADDGGALVFIEVKTRRSGAFGKPEEAVDWRKRKRIIRAANFYLLRNGAGDRAVRFDVASVEVGDGRYKVELIKDAFDGEG